MLNVFCILSYGKWQTKNRITSRILIIMFVQYCTSAQQLNIRIKLTSYFYNVLYLSQNVFMVLYVTYNNICKQVAVHWSVHLLWQLFWHLMKKHMAQPKYYSVLIIYFHILNYAIAGEITVSLSKQSDNIFG